MTIWRSFLLLLATLPLVALESPAAAQEPLTLDEILERAHQRQKTSQEQIQDYVCQSTLVMRQPQKDGTAKTLVVQDKTVYFKSPDREREIFTAITKEGRALTPEEVAQAQKEADQEIFQKHSEKDENGSSFEFGANSPWDPEERPHYDFQLLPADTLRGVPTYVIDFQPREKSEKFIAGRAWLHQDLLQIVRLDFRPSKNPKFVKEAHMILDFSPVAGGFWLPAELKLDAAGGLLFIKKSFQMHQTWREYQVNVGVADSLFDFSDLE